MNFVAGGSEVVWSGSAFNCNNDIFRSHHYIVCFCLFFCCDIQNRLFFFVKIKYFYIFSIENIQNKMYSYVYPFMDVDLAVILRVNMSEVGGGGGSFRGET